MELEFKDEVEVKKFKPVKLEMTIESIKEMRLLYHVFNKMDLAEAIFTHGYGGKANHETDTDFVQYAIFPLLRKKIESLGYEI